MALVYTVEVLLLLTVRQVTLILPGKPVRKTDIGLNFGLFNDRLTAEIGYYNSNNDGLLLLVPQPPSAGLPSSIPTNIGSMYNRGFEFDLKYNVIQKKISAGLLHLIFSTNDDNKVLSLPGITNIIGSTGGLENPSITIPGQPIGGVIRYQNCRS